MDRAVFINYRGDDSHSYGALLYRDLTGQFGDNLVFLDAESIPAGADFVEQLLDRVRSARVLLAVIGSRWLSITNSAGRPRIDDPADWIRRELAEAFAVGVRVIPVLTDQAELPRAAELPADIAALSRCQYRHLRRREPTSDLARIVTDLTSHDPVLAAAALSRDNTPRQLPAAPRLFTGRDTELVALTDATITASEAATSVTISVIGGNGGIGKTWLALTWAYRNLHRFPDGQLFVDLHGFSPTGAPAHPVDVLGGFLDALGIDRDRQPTNPDRRAELYRSVVANRRMLIVLDNAAVTDQVTPLLPGGHLCTVLITSRNRLHGLIARHGARPIHLDVLADAEAQTLLATALGPGRAADDGPSIVELAALCGRFPLALGLIAARAAADPHLPLKDTVADLRTRGLDALDSEDPAASLTTVLSWSLRHLTEQQRQVFALLGIAPGPDTSQPAAICLTGLPERETRALLQTLADACLIDRTPGGRYAMHDLVRTYASTVAHNLPRDVWDSALRRVLDFYTHTAYAASRLLDPHYDPVPLDAPIAGVCPHPLPDAPTALAWLDIEHGCLLAAQHTAVSHGWYPTVWYLAWTLSSFHYRRGHRHDQLAVWQAAADAAIHLPDSTTYTLANRLLAHAQLGQHEDGLAHLHQALALAEHHHDPTQQAHTNNALAQIWEWRGDDQRALEHARRGLDLYRGLGQPVWEARALNTVGWCAARLGDYATARQHCQAALTLHRHHHDPIGEADSLDSLGYIDHRSGHHTEALDQYRRALILLRGLGNTYLTASTLDGLGHPHVALGQTEQAHAAWREALHLYQEQGRDTDAARVQQQLDDLDKPDGERSAAFTGE